jgi:hypothetical protein
MTNHPNTQGNPNVKTRRNSWHLRPTRFISAAYR